MIAINGRSPARGLCLLDSAYVSLLPGLTFEPDGLRDIDGRLHRANDVGLLLAAAMRPGAPVTALVELVADRYRIDPADARADVAAYLAELDAHGLVSIRQPFPTEVRARLVHALGRAGGTLGLTAPRSRLRCPNRRYRPSAGRIIRGCLEAHQSTLVVAVLVMLLVGTLYAMRNAHLGLPGVTALSMFTMLVLALYFGGLIGTAIAHELGHYWTARRLRARTLSVFVRMGGCGLAHAPERPAAAAAISAAGPLVACSLAAAAAIGAWAMPIAWLGPLAVPRANIALATCFGMIALLHLGSLTPMTQEGRQLIISILQATGRSGGRAATS